MTYVEFWAQTTRAVLALSCDFVKFPGRNAPDSCASKVFRNKPSQKLGGASALTSTLNESALRKPSLVKGWKWPALSRHFNDFSVSKRANPSLGKPDSSAEDPYTSGVRAVKTLSPGFSVR